MTPSGATATYQWQESTSPDGTYTAILEATSSTYVPTSNDVGDYIEVMATGSGNYSGSQTSAAKGPVTAATQGGGGSGSSTTSDDTLKSLGLMYGALIPTFTPDTLTYTAGEVYSTTSDTVTVAADSVDAQVYINSFPETQQLIPLSVGDNSVAIKVYAQDGTNQTYSLTIDRASYVAPSSGGGGSAAAVNNTGSATLTPATGGTVNLGSEASVTIPSGALSGSASVVVTVQEDTSPPATPSGFMLLGAVYQFTVGGQDHYTFNSPVTLTLSFDPSKIPAGETPAIYYYDDTTSQWVNIGGTVSSNNDTITVTVNHFTNYAVFAANTVPVPTTPTAPTSPAFSDVSASFWGYQAISSLAGQGIVSGYPDGTFKPDNQITRAEFCAIMDKVLNLAPYTPQTSTFTDVNTTAWYDQAVETAVYAGIVKGYGNGTFLPNDPISRQEIACVLIQALGKSQLAEANANAVTKFTDDQSIASWSRGFVYETLQQGIINGYPDSTFKPDNETTRAEACAMVSNFLSAQK